jgi:hypothetical protein
MFSMGHELSAIFLACRYREEPGRKQPEDEGHRFSTTQRLGQCEAHVYLRNSTKNKNELPGWYLTSHANTHNHPLTDDPRQLPARLTQEDVARTGKVCFFRFFSSVPCRFWLRLGYALACN